MAFLRPEAFEASLLLQLENIHRPFLPPFLRRNDRVHRHQEEEASLYPEEEASLYPEASVASVDLR